jgi:two-component system chemotaxis response regulator CheY
MSKKILITDDSAVVRLTIKKMFLDNDYNNIIEAEDGYEAVIMYKNEKPDLVLMDITMPNKNGLFALCEIKNMFPNAKVIMLAASGQQSMINDAIRYGALDMIMKPVNQDKLLQAVSKALSK